MTALCMHQLNRFEAREICKVFHNEAVALALGSDPCVRFQSNVAVDAVKKLPGISQVARVNILPLQMARFAEDGPRDAGLKL